MKKSLFLCVALSCATFMQAQTQVAATSAQLDNAALSKVVTAAPMQATKTDAPKKVYSDGVYFQRPYGTHFLPSDNVFAVIPAWRDMTFTNKLANPAAGIWTVNGEDASDNVVNNNYVGRWPVPAEAEEGYFSYFYGPELTYGGVTYSMNVTSFRKPSNLCYLNYSEASSFGRLSGQTANDPWEYVYGSKTVEFDMQDGNGPQTYHMDGIRQYMEKPAAPLYLTSFYFPAVTKNLDMQAIPEGKQLYLGIYEVQYTEDANGNQRKGLGNLIATFTAGPSDVDYADSPTSANPDFYSCGVTFANWQEDDLGDLVAVPIVIDKEFAIQVEGFQDVDLGFIGSDLGDCADYDMVDKTYQTFTDFQYMLYTRGVTNQGEKYQYNCLFYMVGFEDAITVLNEDTQFEIPAEGGYAQDSNGDPVLLGTTIVLLNDAGELNDYTIENVPEWLNVSVDDSYYDERGFYMLAFEAQALPAGTDARRADIKIKDNVTGVYADRSIFVYQGDAASSITEASTVSDVKSTKVYNLNGQEVNNNYKGVVIANGQKMLKK